MATYKQLEKRLAALEARRRDPTLLTGIWSAGPGAPEGKRRLTDQHLEGLGQHHPMSFVYMVSRRAPEGASDGPYARAASLGGLRRIGPWNYDPTQGQFYDEHGNPVDVSIDEMREWNRVDAVRKAQNREIEDRLLRGEEVAGLSDAALAERMREGAWRAWAEAPNASPVGQRDPREAPPPPKTPPWTRPPKAMTPDEATALEEVRSCVQRAFEVVLSRWERDPSLAVDVDYGLDAAWYRMLWREPVPGAEPALSRLVDVVVQTPRAYFGLGPDHGPQDDWRRRRVWKLLDAVREEEDLVLRVLDALNACPMREEGPRRVYSGDLNVPFDGLLGLPHLLEMVLLCIRKWPGRFETLMYGLRLACSLHKPAQSIFADYQDLVPTEMACEVLYFVDTKAERAKRAAQLRREKLPDWLVSEQEPPVDSARVGEGGP